MECKVERIGIKSVERRCHGARQRAFEDTPDRGKQKNHADGEENRRWDRAGEPGPPQCIASYQREYQQMQHRQPRGAELLVSRCARIDDAPRNVEMRFGIAIIESPALVRAEPKRASAQQCRQERDEHYRHGREARPWLLRNP